MSIFNRIAIISPKNNLQITARPSITMKRIVVSKVNGRQAAYWLKENIDAENGIAIIAEELVSNFFASMVPAITWPVYFE